MKLVEENNDLKEKILKSNKDLFDTCYRSKEMEELKKMSLRNKDVEIELKKQANEEAERLKKRLADKRTEFDVKLRESRNSLESNE